MISIHGTPSPFCPVGRNIGTVLSQTYDTLKKDVISSMESVTMEKNHRGLSGAAYQAVIPENLFADYAIHKAESFEKHLNQYDVIHFDVQWCMMDAGRMAPYVGFTEAEVHDLFAERKRGNATVVSPKRKYCRSSLLLLFWITAEKLSL